MKKYCIIFVMVLRMSLLLIPHMFRILFPIWTEFFYWSSSKTWINFLVSMKSVLKVLPNYERNNCIYAGCSLLSNQERLLWIIFRIEIWRPVILDFYVLLEFQIFINMLWNDNISISPPNTLNMLTYSFFTIGILTSSKSYVDVASECSCLSS